MWEAFKTYIKEGFTYTGLEITEQNGEALFAVLEIQKRKEELLIKNSSQTNNIEELARILKKDSPLLLCINNAMVLSKLINDNGTTELDALVNRAFPNLDLKNFYFEVVPNSTNYIISISKKVYVDDLINQFNELKIKVFQFSLGPSPVVNLVPYMEDGLIELSYQQIKLGSNIISEMAPASSDSQTTYHINGLDLSNRMLLPFGQILGHINQNGGQNNFGTVSEQLKNGFSNQRFFNLALKSALTFFIAILLVNFLVYNYYNEKIGELNVSVAATSAQKEELIVLSETVKKKQERLEMLNSKSNSRATYYLDDLAQKVPETILLTDLKYQPLIKPVREAKPILLENNSLLVSGVSMDPTGFSAWIENLERLDWIKSVETREYDFASTDTATFLIEILTYESP